MAKHTNISSFGSVVVAIACWSISFPPARRFILVNKVDSAKIVGEHCVLIVVRWIFLDLYIPVAGISTWSLSDACNAHILFNGSVGIL